jgi:peptide/nickel transport system ATP-binding protein
LSALLEVEQLEVSFGGRVAAVRGASLAVQRGETHCLVGESGCGKSVTALAVMNLLARGARRSAGRLAFEGQDLQGLPDSGMAHLRGNAMAMIFQEPMTSLNPAYTVGSQMTEVLRRHRQASQRVASDRAADLLARVGITAPGLRLGQFPHQLSGGLRQRVMIAMALSCNPRLLIADEPTTALDVTVQKQILRLIRSLQEQHGTGVIFVTHNIGVVAQICDRATLLYMGRVMEEGTTATLLETPRHPYTRALIAACPRYDRPGQDLEPIPADVLATCRAEIASFDRVGAAHG